MPLINGIDAAITARFIYLLVRPWSDTPAFKLGIIDRDGNPLKRSDDLKTSQEKAAYTSLDRLVFKLKRILQDIPLVNRNLANFAAALWLIKECYKDPKLTQAKNIDILYEMLSKAQDDSLNEEFNDLREYNRQHPSLNLTILILNEDGVGGGGGAPAVAANNVGSGHIAGTSKQSEPGVGKRRKSLVMGLERRKPATQEPVDATPINAQTRKV